MARILLIEPDTVLSQIYKKALAHGGHKVIAANGAQAAVNVADSQQPDLIILELQLIEHNGIEFLYELRSYPDWQNIPVVINSFVPPTEFNDNDVFWHGLAIRAYLYKPQASLAKLLRTVRASLATAPSYKA